MSIDVLIKDELVLDSVKDSDTCGMNKCSANDIGVYEGILVKESISDETILDSLSINKVEIWRTEWRPKYWTLIYFTSNVREFPKMVSKVMIADEITGNWFVDFKSGNTKYVVFKDKVLKYTIGNAKEKEAVREECRKLGITEDEMNWAE